MADGQRAAGLLRDAPGDVQAKTGRATPGPAAPYRAGGRKAGSVVRHHQPRPAACPVAEPDGEARAFRGVREDVLEQDVGTGREVIAGHLDKRRLRGYLDAHLALLILGERAPESRALGDDRGRVTRGLLGRAAALPPGLADDLANRAFHGGDIIEEPAVPQ
jgi:hypothetical protein